MNLGIGYVTGQTVQPVTTAITIPVKILVTGLTITAFDKMIDRWITEMKQESIEVTLKKLTDAEEYGDFAA